MEDVPQVFSHIPRFQDVFKESGPPDAFRKEDFYDIAVDSLKQDEWLRSRLSLTHRVGIVSSSGSSAIRWSMPRWARQTKKEVKPQEAFRDVDKDAEQEIGDLNEEAF